MQCHVARMRDGAMMRHPRPRDDAPALGYGLASLSVVVGGGIFTLIRKAGLLGAHTAQARRRVRRAMQYTRCGVRMWCDVTERCDLDPRYSASLIEKRPL